MGLPLPLLPSLSALLSRCGSNLHRGLQVHIVHAAGLGRPSRLGRDPPEFDLGRVGALGGEIGGYLAAMAVLLHPDAFAAAVAVSPITDWSLVDAATAERTMKAPEFNAEGYRRTTAAIYADHLTRPLLLLPAVPGSRIATAHAFALIDALSAAGKRAEIATWPDRADAAHRTAATQLVLDFFRQHLGPAGPAAGHAGGEDRR